MIFFFDRNFGRRVPEAIREIGVDVRRHDDLFPPNTPDHTWIAAAARNGWTVITREKLGSGRRKAAIFRRDIKDYGVGCFAIYGQRLTADAIIAVLKAVWPRVERFASSRQPPYLYTVSTAGQFRHIPLT